MRKFWVLTVVGMLLLWVTACASPAAEPTAEPEAAAAEVVNVALVMKTLTNPFFVEMERGAREAADELGITLIVRTGTQETSVQQQISIIETLIEEGIDALVIAPADSQLLVPIVAQAQEAGIVVVNIDNQLDPQVIDAMGVSGVPFISVDNEHGAYLAAKYIADQITEPTEVAVLEGIRTAQNAEDRKNGAMRAFEENENIEVVASETAHWQIDEAYEITGQLFENHPNIGAVFAANDMMALGTIRYLSENNLSAVKVASYDALDEAKAAIETGLLQATIDQQAALQGYTAVETAVRLLNGETVDNEVLVDVMLVTAASLE